MWMCFVDLSRGVGILFGTIMLWTTAHWTRNRNTLGDRKKDTTIVLLMPKILMGCGTCGGISHSFPSTTTSKSQLGHWIPAPQLLWLPDDLGRKGFNRQFGGSRLLLWKWLLSVDSGQSISLVSIKDSPAKIYGGRMRSRSNPIYWIYRRILKFIFQAASMAAVQ